MAETTGEGSVIRRPLHRSDAARGPIVDALRDVGIRVYDLGEPCDLMTLWRGVVRLLEIKSSSKKKLTEAQKKFFQEWNDGPVYRVETVEQALEAHGIDVD